MQVGDLVISKNRYKGQLFIVIGTTLAQSKDLKVQCFRATDGFKTRWSKASTWEVL